MKKIKNSPGNLEEQEEFVLIIRFFLFKYFIVVLKFLIYFFVLFYSPENYIKGYGNDNAGSAQVL
jgi:hypothetical protein